MVNAVLSRHNFILLGLRGQAKTRLIRMLTTLLDPCMPYIAGCEIHDNPYRPISKFARELMLQQGDETPIAWLTPQERYVEKLATPDVTIADMIGDIDPIKAARGGHDISDELTVHYGLCRAPIAASSPSTSCRIWPARFRSGCSTSCRKATCRSRAIRCACRSICMLVFTANPEDYTARGKIITPLKDRIGSEIRTHYPATLEHGIDDHQAGILGGSRRRRVELRVPAYIAEIVEQMAFCAREDKRVDKRSGVSQRLPISVLENVVSNAERRALRNRRRLSPCRACSIFMPRCRP